MDKFVTGVAALLTLTGLLAISVGIAGAIALIPGAQVATLCGGGALACAGGVALGTY